MSNTTREEKDEKAVELLEELCFTDSAIEVFFEGNVKIFNDTYSNLFLRQEKLDNKCQELEEKHNCIVYAIIYSVKDNFEIYNFLVVPDNKEDWDLLLQKSSKENYLVYSYAYNITCEELSEFGTILIKKNLEIALERII